MTPGFSNRSSSPMRGRNRQGGVALIFVLIMMSIVFVIAAVSSRMVTLGERAARNDRDRQTAFQAAEAVMSDAELDIMGPNASEAQRVSMFGALPASDGCSNATDTRGYCGVLADNAYKTIFTEEDDTARQWAKFGEFTDRTDQFPVSDGGALPSKLPRYIIQKTSLSFRNRAEVVGKPFDAFVITAIGYGLQPTTQVVLQAVISKPVPTN